MTYVRNSHRTRIACIAAFTALGALGCSAGSDANDDAVESADESADNDDLTTGARIGRSSWVRRREGSGEGASIGSVSRDTDPKPSAKGPTVGSVSRDVNPKPTDGASGPTVGSVSRDVNPKPTDGASGPTVGSTSRGEVTPRPPTPLAGPIKLGGTFTGEVLPFGSGCPAGTWSTAVSNDGQTFTTTFTGYTAAVGATSSVAAKGCQIALRLKSAQKLQYAVQSFTMTGSAALGEGVDAGASASFYVQGDPSIAVQAKTEQTGPFDGVYTLAKEVPLTEAVWTPCEASRDLNVQTRVSLRGGSAAATGTINAGSTKIAIRVASRLCE